MAGPPQEVTESSQEYLNSNLVHSRVKYDAEGHAIGHFHTRRVRPKSSVPIFAKAVSPASYDRTVSARQGQEECGSRIITSRVA